VAHVVTKKKCDNFDAFSRCPWTQLRVRKVQNRRKQIIVVNFTRMDRLRAKSGHHISSASVLFCI